MNVLEAFAALAARSNSISIEHNQHHSYYESAKLAADKLIEWDVPDDVRQEMIARDSIYCIQCYPDTPIGFWRVYHWDLEQAMQLACQEKTT